MNRYFYDPATASWGSADDLEIFELDDQNMDADEIEQALCDASHVGAGLGLKYLLDRRAKNEPYRRENIGIRAVKDNGKTEWEVVEDDADADAFELYRHDTGTLVEVCATREDATEYWEAITT
jgi:hypothetical protein